MFWQTNMSPHGVPQWLNRLISLIRGAGWSSDNACCFIKFRFVNLLNMLNIIIFLLWLSGTLYSIFVVNNYFGVDEQIIWIRFLIGFFLWYLAQVSVLAQNIFSKNKIFNGFFKRTDFFRILIRRHKSRINLWGINCFSDG